VAHKLIIKPTPADVAESAAGLFVELAQAAAEVHGRFRVALAGGGTPAALYRLLAAEPYRLQIPWPKLDIFWGDERFLPAGHPGRNDTGVLPLLAKAGVPPANIHPVPFIPGDPDAAARQYQATLQDSAGPDRPLLDLALLGLGSDGHTASLFPGTAPLDETARLVVPNRAVYEDRHPERITLTLPALDAAATVLFLVTGTGKAAILRRVLSAAETPPLPAQRIRPASGRLFWLVDEAAMVAP